MELPLSRYISAQVDGNLRALVIEGCPTESEITEAWNIILMEALDAGPKDAEQKLEISLLREIEVLTANLFLIDLLLRQLYRSYHPEFEKRLNMLLKTNFKFDPAQPEKYYALLKNCHNRSRGIKIDLDLKKIQYKAIDEKRQATNTSQPYTREYYTRILITLSDFAQYQVQDTITVFEFYDRIRRLNEYNEEVERRKQQNKKNVR